MKKGIIVLLTFLFSLFWTVPAFGQTQLDINGTPYNSKNIILIQDGVTFISTDAVSSILGCDVVIEGDSITVRENDDSLFLKIGDNIAFFNNEEKQLSASPILSDNLMFLPMRFVLESLGATVSWNDMNNRIQVDYIETRNGMTASELLLKVSEKMLASNTYKMNLSMNMDMNIGMDYNNPELKDLEISDLKMNANYDAEGWFQYEPLTLYCIYDIKISGFQGIPAQAYVTKMLLKDNAMYVTKPDGSWIKTDIPGLNLNALINQSMPFDPVSSPEKINDLGMLVSIGNDREKNGQNYWIISYKLDKEAFSSDYFDQIMKTAFAAGAETIDLQKLDDLGFEMSFSTWVNPNTLQIEYADLNGIMDMSVDLSDQEIKGQIFMNLAMDGSYAMSDYGKKFETPDIK